MRWIRRGGGCWESDCGRYFVRDACWYFGVDENGNMPCMGQIHGIKGGAKLAAEKHATEGA